MDLAYDLLSDVRLFTQLIPASLEEQPHFSQGQEYKKTYTAMSGSCNNISKYRLLKTGSSLFT
jgi:hypothetical protein